MTAKRSVYEGVFDDPDLYVSRELLEEKDKRIAELEAKLGKAHAENVELMLKVSDLETAHVVSMPDLGAMVDRLRERIAELEAENLRQELVIQQYAQTVDGLEAKPQAVVECADGLAGEWG